LHLARCLYDQLTKIIVRSVGPLCYDALTVKALEIYIYGFGTEESCNVDHHSSVV